MRRPQRVRPAQSEEACERGPALRLYERVRVMGFGRIYVRRGGNDIVIAGENDRQASVQQRTGMRDQAVEPDKFIVEFRPRLGIAVGRYRQAISSPWTAASM